MSINIFKRNNDKKVYTEKQAQNIKQNSFNNGVMISFIAIAGVQLLTGGVKIAAKSWKRSHDKMKAKMMEDGDDCESDFDADDFEENSDTDESDEETIGDEPFVPSKADVEKAFAKISGNDIWNNDGPSLETRIDECLSHKTTSVQEESPSEPVTKVDENAAEEKDEVKEEQKEKEIEDDLRDIMNSIEQMPRSKRKEISKQIDDGTFIVPDGINISADTLKRLSTFMMNSAISEEEALKESEDAESNESSEETKEEKTA